MKVSIKRGIALLMVVSLMLSISPLSSIAGGNNIPTVVITGDARNEGGGGGIYFTVSPTDSLVSDAGWVGARYFGNCVYINGTVNTAIPVYKILNDLYYVAVSDVLAVTENMAVTIKGELSDNNGHTVNFSEANFVYNGKWIQNTAQDIVTISSDSRNNSGTNTGIYFTVSPSDKLAHSLNWDKQYTGNCIYVNGTPNTSVPLFKLTSDLYYVALSDVGINPVSGMTVKIEGDLTDGVHSVQFNTATFEYGNDNRWTLKLPLQEVTITDYVANGNKEHRYIYFKVSPTTTLTTTGTTAYYGSCVSINGGDTRADIPIRSMGDGVYTVDFYGTDLENVSKENMSVKISGDLTDGIITMRMTEQEFRYNNLEQMWELYNPSQEQEGIVVTIDSDSRNTIGQTGIYFTVSPADELEHDMTTWSKKYFGECIYVDAVLDTSIPIFKLTNNLYFVALNDVGITSENGRKVKIEGELSDGIHKVKFTSATFVHKNGKWILEGSEEDQEYNEATVKAYDIYEITNLSKVEVPGEKNYNLGDLKQKSNVEVTVKINKTSQPIVFGLAKTIANNPWGESGYLIEINPKEGYILIHTGSGNKKAELLGVDLKEPFELTYGVVDLYLANGTTELAARRVYVKIDGVKILSWQDDDLERELGTYVPIWAKGSVILESSKYKGYELKETTPTVQDISELMDGISTFTTEYGREMKVGATKKVDNTAIRMKVKWHKNKGIKEETDELLLSFGNNSDAGIWMGKEGGYNVLFGKGIIRVLHCDDTKIAETINYQVPNEAFVLEIGSYDRAIYKDGTKIKAHSKVVYIKINGKEVLSFTDTNTERKMGKNLWVYSSKNVKADLISLTSDRYLIKDKVIVSDIYDVTRLSSKVLNQGGEMYLGELTGKTNVALRTKIKLEKDCPEVFFAISKTEKRMWDVDESGWQFWLKPATKQIFIAYGSGTYGSVRAFEFSEEFILEIGECDVRYNNGERYGREVYISIDGEKVLSYMDKDFSRKLGTYVSAYVSRGYDVVLESLTTKGYVPTEKNVKAVDFYDASGYASKTLARGLNYLGEINNEKNCAIKMRVTTDTDTEEFGISLGKAVSHTITEDVSDASVSGWNLWFRPRYNNIEIQHGYYKKSTDISYEFSKSFILEVGSRDVYYQNGKYYGYEVYVKIDGNTVGSWLDENVENRVLGKYVLATLAVDADVKFETLYNTITLPVKYLINGELVDQFEFVTSDTKVVSGEPSKITITTHVSENCKIYNRGVALNETTLNGLDEKGLPDGTSVYEVNAKSGDEIVLTLEKRELKVDEPEKVMDIYEIGGTQILKVPGFLSGPLGNMISQGERQRTNSALQFKVTMPNNGGAVRWSMYSDNSNSWGYNGFIVGLSAGKAEFYSVTYDSLVSSETELVKPGKTLYVECGMVKCYEDGNYKYNRYYIDIGESINKLERACWYDSRERGGYGTTVSFIGMDSDAVYAVYSTKETYTLTDVSAKEDRNKLDTYSIYKEKKAAIYYPEKVVSYEQITDGMQPAAIKFYLKKSKSLVRFSVNGKDVTNEVKQATDGSYIYRLQSVTKDIEFSYIIK